MPSLRDLHAIRRVPPGRLAARVAQRSRRRVYAALPGYAWRSLVRRARALALPDLSDADLHSFATAYREHAAAAAGDGSGWRREGSTVSVRVHHEVVTFDPAEPWSVQGDTLQRMTASYLRWLLLPAGSDDGADDLFGELASAYSTEAAFAHPGAPAVHWHPYAASQRLLSSLTHGAMLARNRERDDPRVAALADAARLHLAQVERTLERDLGLNHLFKNLLASAVYRLAARDGFAAAADRLIGCAEDQVLPGGLHSELTPMYHNLVLADLVAFAAISERVLEDARRDRLDALIERMRSASAVVTFAGGDIALFGDSWRGDAPPSSSLGAGAERPDEVHAEIVSETFVKLAAGAFEVVADTGELGNRENPGHGHDDYLSIEVAYGGRRLVLDYGVESYEGAARERTRGNRNHNGPRVEGRAGAETWGSFRAGRSSPAPVVRTCATRDGYALLRAELVPYWAEGCRLERRIVAGEDFVAVADLWSGLEPGWEPAVTFHLAEPAAGAGDDPNVAWTWDDVRIRTDVVVGRVGSRETSRVFERYGEPTPAVKIDVVPSRDGGGASSLVTFARVGATLPDLRRLLWETATFPPR